VRRLETRLLVRNNRGGVYGVVYKWRPDLSDADLLPGSATEKIPIRRADGSSSDQTWYFPSRKDCLTCHTARANGVLGVKTRQMNRDLTYPGGVTDNELRAWSHVGLFDTQLSDAQIEQLPKLAAADDHSRSLEDRARSYLDANCAQCHRPGGTIASFDARYDTPLAQQGLIDGPLVYDLQIDHSRVVAPHDIWRSIVWERTNTNADIRMPPLARETIDVQGVALLREWILSLPGRAVLDPPAITPAGGNFAQPVNVQLKTSEPGAVVRYTTDGSVPGPSDSRYDAPIRVTQPTVLRARAYKDGFTRSITSQQVFVVGGSGG
jgi:mono/diheme cytochrome c family protein